LDVIILVILGSWAELSEIGCQEICLKLRFVGVNLPPGRFADLSSFIETVPSSNNFVSLVRGVPFQTTAINQAFLISRRSG
jgi:hypothetical protein